MKPQKHILQGYLPTKDAARILDRSPSQVARYVRIGLLKAIEIGNTYYLETAQLKNFRYPKPGPKGNSNN